jgi:hypothetical protein
MAANRGGISRCSHISPKSPHLGRNFLGFSGSWTTDFCFYILLMLGSRASAGFSRPDLNFIFFLHHFCITRTFNACSRNSSAVTFLPHQLLIFASDVFRGSTSRSILTYPRQYSKAFLGAAFFSTQFLSALSVNSAHKPTNVVVISSRPRYQNLQANRSSFLEQFCQC